MAVHEDILNLIPLYVDNLLDEEESILVKKHIDACPHCKKEVDFMMSIITKTKDLPKICTSSDFSAKVTAKAKQQKLKKQRTALVRRISSGVAAAAVLALCVVSLDVFDTNEPAPENTPSLSAENVHRSSSDIVDVPTTDKVKTKTPVQTAVVPDESKEPPVDETDFTPAMFSEVDLEYYTVATIEVTEENAPTVEELTKNYEKDDFGYIVPDMNRLLRKLNDAGIEVKTEVSPDITNDYIIVK